ncbi:hypothetical protein HPP92_024642 [Vanilla planifolia]|uniref:Uncharacterized protein n=1 Tax=Vanilla planifolia TaxID=51239 RepID=A0A835UBQ3_VANPL|nr:hypothetical protein HPP92_024642 [Vanilla planifolia]
MANTMVFSFWVMGLSSVSGEKRERSGPGKAALEGAVAQETGESPHGGVGGRGRGDAEKAQSA